MRSPTGSGTSQYCLSATVERLPSPGKMSKSGMSIDPVATDAEIGTMVAQLGLGRRLSGPPHGARASQIRQGLSTGLLEWRRRGDETSILPNRSAISRPRRSHSHERSLAAGTPLRECRHEVNRATGAGRCRER